MFIRILTGAAPLLGLLGTVTGMLKTFRGLSIRQSAETMNLVAQGISEALITTETGLTIGIAGTLLLFLIGAYRKRLIAGFEGFEKRDGPFGTIFMNLAREMVIEGGVPNGELGNWLI